MRRTSAGEREQSSGTRLSVAGGGVVAAERGGGAEGADAKVGLTGTLLILYELV
jgi:hypothetical protein